MTHDEKDSTARLSIGRSPVSRGCSGSDGLDRRRTT